VHKGLRQAAAQIPVLKAISSHIALIQAGNVRLGRRRKRQELVRAMIKEIPVDPVSLTARIPGSSRHIPSVNIWKRFQML
jgi:hypothetical protein